MLKAVAPLSHMQPDGGKKNPEGRRIGIFMHQTLCSLCGISVSE